MALNESRESVLVTGADEVIEELPIGNIPTGVHANEPGKVMEDRAPLTGGHGQAPSQRNSFLQR
jgi:hypothetical protein